MSERLVNYEKRKRRPNLTDAKIANLPRKKRRYTMADPEMRALYLRVPSAGPIVFAVAVRNQYDRKVWAKVGSTDVMTIEKARDSARDVISRIKKGLPAFEPVPDKPDSYAAVAEKYLTHAGAQGIRTRREIERVLRKLVLPVWGTREFVSIRRKTINELLDSVAEQHSAHVADHTLAIIRMISSWWATRNENYLSPFIGGMRRTRAAQRKRSRILNDDELRRVWLAAESDGVFGGLIRILLLTAQRRDIVLNMKWDDVSDDGVWEIADPDPDTSDRAKGNAGALQLPTVALEIIRALPRLASNPHVFAAARGNGHLAGYSRRKEDFDKICGVAGWRLHDLRRSARSLMSRAGINSDHAERVMGHAIVGVEGVYNRHDYYKEKSAALAKLESLIISIVRPPKGSNVVPLVGRKRRRK
jgi:integrase